MSISREEALAVKYVETLYERRITLRNIHKTVHALRDFLNWCKFNRIKPLSATHEQVQNFIGRKVYAGSTGPTRIHGPDKQRDDRKALRQWWTWMQERGFVTEHPALDIRLVKKGPKPRPLRTVPKSFRRAVDQGKQPMATDKFGPISTGRYNASRQRSHRKECFRSRAAARRIRT